MVKRWYDERSSTNRYTIRSISLSAVGSRLKCTDIGELPDRASAWRFEADHFQQVAGDGHSAWLLTHDMAGQESRVGLPDIPKEISIQGDWETPASVSNDRVVFCVPTQDRRNGGWSNPVLVVDLHRQAVSRIGNGTDPIWVSNDQVVFSRAVQGYSDLKLEMIDPSTGDQEEITVWRDSIPTPPFFAKPEGILQISWIPNTDVIICEVNPMTSGRSYLFAVNVRTRESVRLPASPLKSQWVWVPGKH